MSGDSTHPFPPYDDLAAQAREIATEVGRIDEPSRSGGPRLDRLVDALGSALLRIVTGPLDQQLDGVVIHDPAGPIEITPRAVVLGLGIADDASATAALQELGAAGAAALLVKAPVAMSPTVVAAAADHGVALVEVGREVAWEQLFLLIRRLIDPSASRSDSDAPRDLFQLANEIASLVDAPITIEDRSYRVLAFSSGQGDTDEGRVQTILGRRVPEMYQHRLAEFEIYQKLAATSDPIFIPSVFPGHRPRTAVAIRAGATTLGYIWAVVDEPLAGHRLRALRAAVDIVALELMRERAVTSAASQVRAEHLTSLLTATQDTAERWARRLGVLGSTICVAAIRLQTADRNAAGVAELDRLADGFALHLRLVHPASAVTTVGDTVYGLVPVSDESAALRVVEDFVRRVGSRELATAAVGRAVDAVGIAMSRADADDVLRLLPDGDRVIASARAVRTDLMLLRLADDIGEWGHSADGLVAVLRRHDAEHRSDLVGTLAAYLDCFGDIGKAAARLHVHPNTFRYRLARLGKVADADLDDPDVRLAALIDLRLDHLRQRLRRTDP